MEELHGHTWGHDSDKALLQFLQAFSAQLDGQMSACRRSLDDLAQSATDLTTDLARIGTAVSLLSNARFIEKVTAKVTAELSAGQFAGGSRMAGRCWHARVQGVRATAGWTA